jgi:hypothetical protein
VVHPERKLKIDPMSWLLALPRWFMWASRAWLDWGARRIRAALVLAHGRPRGTANRYSPSTQREGPTPR